MTAHVIPTPLDGALRVWDGSFPTHIIVKIPLGLKRRLSRLLSAGLGSEDVGFRALRLDRWGLILYRSLNPISKEAGLEVADVPAPVSMPKLVRAVFLRAAPAAP